MALSRLGFSGAAFGAFSLAAQQLAALRIWAATSVTAPLMLMYFLMLLMNTLLRDTKDTLLVTSQAGVEAIPILKSWAVIPFSFLYFLFYYKIASVLSPRQVFMVILFLFNAFYFTFAFALYPRQYTLVPTNVAAYLHDHLPEQALPLQHLVENWLLGFFYCVSELYASAVCQFLFWQVANDVVSVEHAKSIYPLIGAMGNLGMVCAGSMLRLFANERDLVAASAYLRSPASLGGVAGVSSGTRTIEPGSASTLGRGGQPRISFLSDFMLPLTGTAMKPNDLAWQTTLLAMSILLVSSSIIIVFSYDAVYARSENSEVQYSLLTPAVDELDSFDDQDIPQPSTVQETEMHVIGPYRSGAGTASTTGSFKMKRRTGSGTVQPATPQGLVTIGGATGEQSGDSIYTDGQPKSELFWDLENQPDGPRKETSTPTFANDATGPVNGAADSSAIVSDSGSSRKKSKPKLSLIEGLRALAQSTPLRAAAIMVVSYGVSISLVEVSWKGQVKKALESPNDYSRFMGMFWTITGLVSMLFMLIGRVVLQRIGYAPAVLFTPASMAIAGSLFFIVSVVQDLAGPRPTDAIAWSAYFGGAAVLFAKSAKYAFFDATKEIIFIPLDDASKSLGKAAIDVVAYRLSKSGGSVVLQIVIFFFGAISSVAGILPVALVFALVCFLWIHAAITASKFITSASDTVPQHVV